MAVYVMEITGSRESDLKSDAASGTTLWMGYGSFDNDVMEAAFAAAIPTTFPTTFRVMQLDNVKVKHEGGLCWTCTAEYKSWAFEVSNQDLGATSPPPTPDNPGDTPDAELNPAQYSINISAVTEKITQSKETRHKVMRFGGANENAPDNQRAIGVTADGKVEGCDRFSPHLEISISGVFPSVNLTYIGRLFDLVGKTNAASFYGFAAGEVLFLGADMQSKDRNRLTITFKFVMQPNETNVVICDSLTIPVKKGFDYIWVAYEPDLAGDRVWMEPFAAYCERIYDSGNFDVMQIGH